MIALFALRLVLGMSLMWCLMPRRQVTSGFFRIQMLVALGLSVLAAATLDPYSTRLSTEIDAAWLLRPLAIALAVAAFAGSVLWTLERRRAGGATAGLMAAVAAVAVVAAAVHGETTQAVESLLPVLAGLTSAGLVGGAVTSMLLGHWYLTAPTMSVAPLSRLTLYYGGAALLRTGVAGAGAALLVSSGEPLSVTHGIWLALRWLAGLAGPLVLCAMTLRILRYRNTQAATGVLFASVILVFIGEMTALLLERDLSLPL